jgi:CheY-like chemotaxis protein
VAVEVIRIRPELPVVLVSGFVRDELRKQAAAAGVRHVVQKPYNGAQLSEVLLRHARGR